MELPARGQNSELKGRFAGYAEQISAWLGRGAADPRGHRGGALVTRTSGVKRYRPFGILTPIPAMVSVRRMFFGRANMYRSLLACVFAELVAPVASGADTCLANPSGVAK